MAAIISAVQGLVTILYHITLPLQNALFAARGALLSYLPVSFQRRINASHDLGIALINLACGRILPSLRPYLPKSPDRLRGRHAIVTGANSGIGLQIVKDLARQGAEVVLAVRSKERGEAAREQVVKQVPQAKDRVKVMILDTSSLDSVRSFVKTWTTEGAGSDGVRLDILVHNAGIAASSDSAKEFSDDGFPLVYATNFLGSFLLTHLMEPHFSADARVVLTSSTGQYGGAFGTAFKLEKVTNSIEPGFHVIEAEKAVTGDASIPTSAYAISKGMQCALVIALQRKWTREGKKQIAHSFTPGFTATEIFGKYKVRSLRRDFVYGLIQSTVAFGIDVSEGSVTGTWLASAPLSESEDLRSGGRYWDRMTCRKCRADALNDRELDRLWTRWSKDANVEWR